MAQAQWQSLSLSRNSHGLIALITMGHTRWSLNYLCSQFVFYVSAQHSEGCHCCCFHFNFLCGFRLPLCRPCERIRHWVSCWVAAFVYIQREICYFCPLFSSIVSDPSGIFYQAVVDKNGDFDNDLINKTICSFSCSLLLVCRLFFCQI